jgi:hypothetical protein
MRCYQAERGNARYCDDCGAALAREYVSCVQDGMSTYILCDACAARWVDEWEEDEDNEDNEDDEEEE